MKLNNKIPNAKDFCARFSSFFSLGYINNSCNAQLIWVSQKNMEKIDKYNLFQQKWKAEKEKERERKREGGIIRKTDVYIVE